jgi:hypothetical protein
MRIQLLRDTKNIKNRLCYMHTGTGLCTLCWTRAVLHPSLHIRQNKITSARWWVSIPTFVLSRNREMFISASHWKNRLYSQYFHQILHPKIRDLFLTAVNKVGCEAVWSIKKWQMFQWNEVPPSSHTLKMEVVCFTEVLASFYQPTQHHILEDCNFLPVILLV